MCVKRTTGDCGAVARNYANYGDSAFNSFYRLDSAERELVRAVPGLLHHVMQCGGCQAATSGKVSIRNAWSSDRASLLRARPLTLRRTNPKLNVLSP
jgi:hypothetical protein